MTLNFKEKGRNNWEKLLMRWMSGPSGFERWAEQYV